MVCTNNGNECVSSGVFDQVELQMCDEKTIVIKYRLFVFLNT